MPESDAAGRTTPMTVTFRHPRREEMALRQAWLGDPELMAYNAGSAVSSPGYDAWTGCLDFPESAWHAWYVRWVGDPAPGTAYWFVEKDGVPVGHAHHRRAADRDRVVADIGLMVVPAVRGRGLGRAVLDELVRRVFGAGFEVVRNEFEITREPALSLHRELGFCVLPGGERAAERRTVVTLELPRDAWAGR